MVIQITKRCNFECWHCFRDCKKDDEHMSDKTFEDTMKFIKQFNRMPLLISGGEPTLHPKFREYVLRIHNEIYTAMIIASNGWYIDKNGNVPKEFKFDFPHILQITNDFRYYPKKINAIHNHSDYTGEPICVK